MPRKVFVAGEILTASDVNTNLMDQAVMRFADSTARGTAIPSPTEGMVSWLDDVNQVQAYNGSSWAPVGRIVQVVSATKKDTFSASVASGAISGDVTGLTVSVTPNLASSKLLVFVSVTGGVSATEDTQFGVYRDGAVSTFVGDAAGNRKRLTGATYTAASGLSANSVHFSFLDDASSTSATTYSVRISHSGTGTQTVYVNRGNTDTDSSRTMRGASSITVMEVAA